MNKWFSIVIFLLGFAGNAYSSDSLNVKNNVITYFPFQLDGSISLCYYRKINNYMEFAINPRVKLSQDAPSGNDTWEIFMNEPYWYKRFLIRSGLMFSYQGGFIEPMIQYDHGSFNNEFRWEGEMYNLIQGEDHVYNSIGLLCLIGLLKDFKYFRFKLYVGMGSNLRFYHKILHEKEYDGFNRFTQKVIIKDYKINVISINGGIEFGFRF